MGSHLCLGMRRKSGEIISASSYSHVFSRLLVEADLATPNEDELGVLIGEYRDKKDYGPLPVAPYGSGILFFDFVSGTIFDGQSISWVPALTRETIIRTLFERPERFDIYVPFFVSKLSFDKRDMSDGKYRMPDIITTEFPKARDRETLWANAGIETSEGTMTSMQDREEVVARAIVPAGSYYDADFLALMLDLPAWNVVSIDTQDVAAWEKARTDFRALGLLGEADENAWTEHVDDLEAWNAAHG